VMASISRMKFVMVSIARMKFVTVSISRLWWHPYLIVSVDVCKATGMDPHDIAATLQVLNMVVKKDDK
jgi:hypothetical protein